MLYDIQMVKDLSSRKALIDSGSEVNAIAPELVRSLGLPTLHTNWGAATIDGSRLTTHGMVLAKFSVDDKLERTRWFEETFLIANVSHDVVLGMPFLKLGNPDVHFAEGSLTWRDYSVSTSLPTERRIELVEPETFAEDARDDKSACFVVQVAAILDALDDARRVNLQAISTTEEIKLPVEYADYEGVFSAEKADELPSLTPDDHRIVLEEGKSHPHGPIYSLGPTELEALRGYIEVNLNNGFIRPSTSPAGAPILFIRKPSGGLRLCVDYRGLNNITINNRYPLPLVGEALDRLGRAKEYTQLDLIHAYHRVRIAKGDEWKTAFRTRYGHFEYQVMPFGLSNAPATFQALINKVLAEKLDVFCIVYLDDILIYTEETGSAHTDAVKWVVEQLRKHGLYANLQKCRFSQKEVRFLGYIISPEGIRMENDRIESVRSWPRPQCVRDIQVFIGFANFYRRFIKGFSKIARPLTAMLKTTGPKMPKSDPFLTAEALVAFDQLKGAFVTAPVLRHFDAERHIRVETDASGYAIGGILSQKDDESHWHPVAYFSRKMIPAERNYETHDAELLAIVEAFRHWRHYLEGSTHEVLVLTDHNNLKRFMDTKRLGGRQIRWAQELSRYNFRIDYRQGSHNPAHALSRPAQAEADDDELIVENRQILHRLQDSLLLNEPVTIRACKALSQPKKPRERDYSQVYRKMMLEVIICGTAVVPDLVKSWAVIRAVVAEEGPYTAIGSLLPRLPELLAEDKGAQAVRKRLATSEVNAFSGVSGEPWKESGDVLYYEGKPYIPETLRTEIMARHHDDPLAGPLGIEKTQELLTRKYHWDTIKVDVEKYVDACDVCMRSKSQRHKPYGSLQSLPIPSHKWKDITMDFVTGLPRSCDWRGVGYDSILVIVDCLAKMVHYEAVMKTLTAEGLAEVIMDSVVRYHGLPDSIVTDRGSLFTSQFWPSLCYFVSIKRRLSTAFHPQTDGHTERQNSTLEAYLRSFVSFEQDNWVQYLPMAEFAFNNSKHSSTGLTPFELNCGYHPRMSYEDELEPRSRSRAAGAEVAELKELMDLCKANLRGAQESQARYHNKATKDRVYSPGESVWLDGKHFNTKRNRKLGHKFLGPFMVIEPIGKQAYRIQLPPRWRIHDVFLVSLLEKNGTKKGGVDKELAEQIEFNENEPKEYEVESIQDSAVYARESEDGRPVGLYYLIHWKGYPESEDSWEPYAAIKHLRKMVRLFHRIILQNPPQAEPQSIQVLHVLL